MAQFIGGVWRNWQIFSPPVAEKAPNALRFGILGASSFAPFGLIAPSKTLPDIVIQAVAARDATRAAQYAAKHGIPDVKSSYQELLDDPSIDCVYIPLPNSLHFEWAIRALKAGKHVYLEKPSVTTLATAEELFNHAVLSQQPKAPVLMEACHFSFHPAWVSFMSFVMKPHVAEVTSSLWCLNFQFSLDDIRFNHELGGGAMLDLGPYAIGSLRLIFGTDPVECEDCDVQCLPSRPKVDRGFTARFKFPNGGVGVAMGDLKSPITRTSFIPAINVRHRPVVMTVQDLVGSPLENVTMGDEEEVQLTRVIRFDNYVQPAVYHCIQVDDEYAIRKKATTSSGIEDEHKGQGSYHDNKSGERVWKTSKTIKAYTFEEVDIDEPSEIHWTSWRHCLGQFVTKVRGEEKPQRWWSAEDSISAARMIEMAYEASGLGPRPTIRSVE